MLELKNSSSILRKKGLFANKMYCGLTTLFVKIEIFFYRCNFTNKQTKFLSIIFSYRLDSIGRIQNIPENVWKWSPKSICTFYKMSLYNMTNGSTPFKNE